MTVPVRCVCVTGPTACGKTELALELARDVPLEIVSMDSAMVYRGLDIGTAKPSRTVRARVPHHLIDVVEPTETYSAGRFARDATAAIEAIAARGRLPLVVGGTLLYLRALRDGLAMLPRADSQVRARLDAEAEAVGWQGLHARLASVDPRAAARIAPQDRQRIQRALEVHAVTGRTLTELQEASAAAPAVDVTVIAIVPEQRAELGSRIERRFDAMVNEGLVAEVEALRSREELEPELPSLRAVGYRQVWGYLEGRYDWDEARRRAIYATRQLAKRQLTWLRAEPSFERWRAFDSGVKEQLRERISRWRAAATVGLRLC